jgi:hypothetical protein
MTKQASGAISTIQLTGRQAEEILRGIFQPLPAEFKTGEIFVGEITDGDKRIDQAAVGCEGEDSFAIHCHGNPLICEMIMDLLAQKGAELTDADTLRTKTTNSEDCPDTISLEAELEYPHTPTLFAAKLVLKFPRHFRRANPRKIRADSCGYRNSGEAGQRLRYNYGRSRQQR